ncbi:MAG TPA: gas vesicle protein [Methylomirabilota bacterium]|nr:gas vesicle protein [Methylomirabilota bacterium]
MDRARGDLQPPHRGSGLVDVLDRVLDKGLAIAGDIKISLAEVELLTIRIRLIVCSIDKAQEIGLDWWKHDAYYARGKSAQKETQELRRHIGELEARIARLTAPSRTVRARRAIGKSK